MKIVFVACGILAASAGYAQIPDVKIHLDATFSYRIQNSGKPLANFYDVLGRPSTLSLWFYTEQGFRAFVAEKLQHVPGDRDTDLFDEYYLEDERIWRVGKQYLPFGAGIILHESAVAARGDTNLIVEGLPVSVALCDAGQGLDNGVIGRLGSMIGISSAYGRNFGTAGTSLANVRRPEDAPGPNHGWKEAFGLDATRRLSTHWTLKTEAVNFRRGETALDKDCTVFDFGITLSPKRGESTTLAWSRIQPDRKDFLRLSGSYSLSKNIAFEPTVRFRNASLFDISAEIRVRI